jgi:sulfate adenylyltransferase
VLTEREFADFELLVSGGFAPVDTYLTRDQYHECMRDGRVTLPDGTKSPLGLPIVLTATLSDLFSLSQEELDEEVDAGGIAPDVQIVAPDGTTHLATLHVSGLFPPEAAAECEGVYGTRDPAHPGVAATTAQYFEKCYCLEGEMELVAAPRHFDFSERRSVAAMRAELADAPGPVLAFQTRNPLHNAHLALLKAAIDRIGGTDQITLVVTPAVGPTQTGDVPAGVRMAAYRALLATDASGACAPDAPRNPFPGVRILLRPLPLAMRMAGPREALQHAVVRRALGATHFVVGRDHAGPSVRRSVAEGDHAPDGMFYGPDDARLFVESRAAELDGLEVVTFSAVAFDARLESYAPAASIPFEHRRAISGTEARRRLAAGGTLPEWFTPAAVSHALLPYFARPRGCVVLCCGLSGAGKTTLTQAVAEKLRGGATSPFVKLLDGDEVRTNLSKGLGFSRVDRSTNVRRVGYVAAAVAAAGGVALCANIAPYADDRTANRQTAEAAGVPFLEVFVDTPLAECERRAPKGLYARARAGTLKGFTGVNDPWEPPETPDVHLDGAEDLGAMAERLADAIRHVT